MECADKTKYDWNHRVGPHGNLGHVDPILVAAYCNLYDIPWYSDGYPFSSGIYVFCKDDELWNKIIKSSTLRR